MSYQLPFTGEEVKNVLDGRYNSFVHAIGDSLYTQASPRTLLANTEYHLTNDTLATNNTSAPTYITSRWNTTDNKISMPEELDSPVYVNDITLTFAPQSANTGKGLLRVYIDESGTQDFANDPLIRAYQFDYKGVPEPISEITTWFFGSDIGFDAKNNGVYFTIESELAGNLYDVFFSIYRT